MCACIGRSAGRGVVVVLPLSQVKKNHLALRKTLMPVHVHDLLSSRLWELQTRRRFTDEGERDRVRGARHTSRPTQGTERRWSLPTRLRSRTSRGVAARVSAPVCTHTSDASQSQTTSTTRTGRLEDSSTHQSHDYTPEVVTPSFRVPVQCEGPPGTRRHRFVSLTTLSKCSGGTGVEGVEHPNPGP